MTSVVTDDASKSINIDVTTTQGVEAVEPETSTKPKYKRPYVMTEKRKAAVDRMLEGRKKALAGKKTKKAESQETLLNEIQQLKEKLAHITEPKAASEIVISKPVKVEKPTKKKEPEYMTPEQKQEQLQIQQSLQDMPLQEPQQEGFLQFAMRSKPAKKRIM